MQAAVGLPAQGRASGLFSNLMSMAGLSAQAAQLTAAMRVANSIIDALAVYVFMAALTCTLEARMPSRVWWLESGTAVPLVNV